MTPNDLSAKQLKVIVALANGDSINSAAQKAGCHERTIDIWLKLPEFKLALRNAISEMYESAIAESVRHSISAIKLLSNIVDNEEASNRDRIAAAKELLANASKWRDWQLEDRISRLEEAIKNGSVRPD